MSKFYVTAFLSAVSAALGFSFLSSTAHAQFEQSNWQSIVALVFGVKPEALVAIPGGPFLLIIFIALIYVLFFAAVETSPLKKHAKAIALLLALTVITIGNVTAVFAWLISWLVLFLGAFAIVVVLIFTIFVFYRKMISKRIKSVSEEASKLEVEEAKLIKKEEMSILGMMQELKSAQERLKQKRTEIEQEGVQAVKKGKPLSKEQLEKNAAEINRLDEKIKKINDTMLFVRGRGEALEEEERKLILKSARGE